MGKGRRDQPASSRPIVARLDSINRSAILPTGEFIRLVQVSYSATLASVHATVDAFAENKARCCIVLGMPTREGGTGSWETVADQG